MAFADFPAQQQAVALLQRSLERGRLAHAYLFTGDSLDELEGMALALAKTLNCQQPRRAGRAAVDCCDECLACRKIDHANHADVQWLRPEMRSRQISVDQIRELIHTVNLKPTEAEWKVAAIASADRLTPQATNAFLKTLEEPPSRSILILLTTEPQQLLETILSRCLRLNFAGGAGHQFAPQHVAWLQEFGAQLAGPKQNLLGRYRVLGQLLARLAALKDEIKETLTARSPLQRYADADPKLQEKWEEELDAAIEAEYRRQRADLLLALHWWLRDVWLGRLGTGTELLAFPELREAVAAVTARVTAAEALENLRVIEQTQRLLRTNVQEALALEVGLLKLRL
ncbi:MAG: DNA-directed DNA polymerase [Limisphaerales bacterium]|nr:MAG: DNA-directed DNA polymerase [Limisphaerales bacterium]TXT49244.1 MAG: DNA-directed DNA polymerase [Limisphaerales bacterium]